MKSHGYGMISGGPVLDRPEQIRVTPWIPDPDREARQRRGLAMSLALVAAEKRAKEGKGTKAAKPAPKPQRPTFHIDPAAVREQYERGHSLSQLAMRYRVSKETIGALVKRAGGTLRPAGGGKRHHPLAETYDVPLMVQQYLSGMGLVAIGQHHGCGKTAVRGRLIKAGVTLRPAHVNTGRRGTS